MTETQDAVLLKRVAWRLVPLLTVIYLIVYIDCANISYAKLTMVQALHMTEEQFGFASSVFFIGYLIFEVPSNVAIYGITYGCPRWSGASASAAAPTGC